jgi:lipopolysaccharide/colanic/teichoic acid biosynthesis glycosyltransferase
MTGFAPLKRFTDMLGAAMLVTLLSPVLIVGCVLILVSMGRPILYLHTRSGQHGRPFRMIKLRTMLDDSTGKMTDAERVTPTGLILRKFSIDEIPQLFNVLHGSMSLVGPRPLLREYDDRYSAEQARRLLVKPGLTGLAQVEGRNDLDWDEKLKLDVQYVDTQSFWLDVQIMLRTPLVVLSASGFRRSGEATKFGE